MTFWAALSAAVFFGGLGIGWWAHAIRLRTSQDPKPPNDTSPNTLTWSTEIIRQAALLAAVRDVLIVFDITDERRIVRWNSAAETLYGYTAQEAIGQSISSLLKTRDSDLIAAQNILTFAAGNAWQGDLVRYNKAGERLFIQTTLSALRDPQGSVRQVLEIDHDITEHVHLQETLSLSERRFRLLFETMQTGIVVQDSTGRVVLVNPAALRMFGLTEDQVCGKAAVDPAWTVFDEEGSPIPVEQHPLRKIISARETIIDIIAGIYRPATRDRVWLMITARPELDADGQVRQVVFANIDITQRMLAQHALRDSHASFMRLFANNPLPMWVYDLKTLAFLDVNEAAVTRYGYSRNEFLSMTIADIRPEAERARLLDTILEPRPTALRATGKWLHTLKDGGIIDVEITSHVLEFAERAAVLVVAQDITDRKRAEQALRTSEERFRALTENGTDLICIRRHRRGCQLP